MSYDGKETPYKAGTTFDISVIVTFHNEGRLAYRTLRALERAINFAMSHGVTVEVVQVLDRVSDSILREICKDRRLKTCCSSQYHEVDYGQLAFSRNHGVQVSKGGYIAILDGDDLFCENWLVKAHARCVSDVLVIAHPQLSYYFPKNVHVFLYGDMADPGQLLDTNPWPAMSFAARNCYETVPYQPDTTCFGYEDWRWNCETTVKGFKHEIIEETLYAYRQKPEDLSLLAKSNAAGLVLAPNSLTRRLFSRPLVSQSEIDSTCKTQRKPGKRMAQIARTTPRFFSNIIWGMVNFLKSPALASLRNRISNKNKERIKQIVYLVVTIFFHAPDDSLEPVTEETHELDPWAIRELLWLNQIDPELYVAESRVTPYRSCSRLHNFITPEMSALVKTEKPRIIMLPWLVRGGADLVALHYMYAQPCKTFVITTEMSANPWQKFLPKGAVHIDIGNMPIYWEEKLRLLLRLLLETDFEFAHVINSKLAFETIIKSKSYFAKTKLFASFFGFEYNHLGFALGYISDYLPDLLDIFTRLSTDSLTFKLKLEDLFGLSEGFVVNHRMPFSPPHFPMRRQIRSDSNFSDICPSDGDAIRLLWAGRICPELNPELAIKAVSDLIESGHKFELDLWGEADNCEYPKVPENHKIRIMGPYDSLGNLPLENYHAMIYPALYAGLPNAIMEALGNGVPVVASDVGGIHELVDDQTGWLVRDYTNPEAFKATLKQMYKNRESISQKSRNAATIVDQKHSWEDFQKQARLFYDNPPSE